MVKRFIEKVKENNEKKRKAREEKKDNLIRAFRFLGDSEEESIESANYIFKLKSFGKYVILISTAIFAAYVVYDIFFKVV